MTALPDTAAAAAATADPDRALQELKDKRIALSAKLTSLLDSSVLQVMSSQRGAGQLPGAKPAAANGAHDDSTEKTARVNAGIAIIASLEDAGAQKVLGSLGLLGMLYDMSLKFERC